MTIAEAAKILGVSQKSVRDMQRNGSIPKPIPDDYFDAVIKFRVRIEEAARRKVDRQRGLDA